MTHERKTYMLLRDFIDKCETALSVIHPGQVTLHVPAADKVGVREAIAAAIRTFRGPITELLTVVDRYNVFGYTGPGGLLRLPPSVREALPLPDVLVFKKGRAPGTWVMAPAKVLGDDWDDSATPTDAQIIAELRQENRELYELLAKTGALGGRCG